MKIKNNFFEMEVIKKGMSIKKLTYKDSMGENIDILKKYRDEGDYLENKDYLNSVIGPKSGRYFEEGNIVLHGGSNAYTYKDFEIYNPKVFKDCLNELSELNLQVNDNTRNKLNNLIEAILLKENRLNLKRVEVEKILRDFNSSLLKGIYLDECELVLGHLFDEKEFIEVFVVYILNNNTLEIKFLAIPKEEKHINLTSHLYFSLGLENIGQMSLKFNFNENTVKKNMLSIGYENLKESFNFNKERKIGEVIIDDCFIKSSKFEDSIILRGKKDISINSDNSSFVLYTYDFPFNNKDKRSALAIEAQEPPNIINFDNKMSSNLYFNPQKPYLREIKIKVS